MEIQRKAAHPPPPTILTDEECLTDVLASFLCTQYPSVWKQLCTIQGPARLDTINKMTKVVVRTMLNYVNTLPINNP